MKTQRQDQGDEIIVPIRKSNEYSDLEEYGGKVDKTHEEDLRNDIKSARKNAIDYGLVGAGALAVDSAITYFQRDNMLDELRRIAGSAYNALSPVAEQVAYSLQHTPYYMIGLPILLVTGLTLLGLSNSQRKEARKLENQLDNISITDGNGEYFPVED